MSFVSEGFDTKRGRGEHLFLRFTHNPHAPGFGLSGEAREKLFSCAVGALSKCFTS